MRTLRHKLPHLAPLTLLVAALLLLGSGFELHPEHWGLQHGVQHAAGTGQTYLETCHDAGEQSRHVEAARPAHRQDCAACLFRLQVSGGELNAAPELYSPSAGGDAVAEVRRGQRATSLDLRIPRGPPLA
ncbi:MAG: hypothetical protein SX243_18535 [Acidobacteriota bacterium]|nr:hypothetical protein [Acidobacteriota bacterium]